MAILHPFYALRPVSHVVKQVASVPYDVVSVAEARTLAEGNPHSFLHVIRPEIDLPEGTDEHDDAVYKKGAENLRAYAESDISMQEEVPALYVYRLIMDGRAQTGIFGCVAVSDYDDDTILKHEKTRPAKEDDRTRHILTQQAHAEPVMLTFRDDDTVRDLIDQTTDGDPLYDFTADDGVQHTLWKVAAPEALVEAFAAIPKLYVADGHHRCKAASRAAAELRTTTTAEPPEFEFFPAVLFPMADMHIMAYNRIVYDLPVAPVDFMKTLTERFEVKADVENPVPPEKGKICLYLDGQWHQLTLPPSRHATVDAQLDVARLNEHLLEPLLGITDVRTDPNVDFVGGIRGTDELERRVDSGEADLAFSMVPTRIEELVAVSDAGLLMPPKSTWFEPKLRSGLLVHLF
ncbi:MAG: DUF1015 family protein [Bacteroidetes bacterium]|jgi:uncharacterized protein (DUF1015 family)|nr:DUF1015 family protein [Bacteroidota bacterium]